IEGRERSAIGTGQTLPRRYPMSRGASVSSGDLPPLKFGLVNGIDSLRKAISVYEHGALRKEHNSRAPRGFTVPFRRRQIQSGLGDERFENDPCHLGHVRKGDRKSQVTRHAPEDDIASIATPFEGSGRGNDPRHPIPVLPELESESEV